VKLFVGVPAYDRRITVETARALLNEQGAAGLTGIELQIAFAPGSSLVTTARDILARDFLAGEAERLIFIDSDIAWEAGQLLALARHDVDVVGGAYRLKQEAEAYPVSWLDRPLLQADRQTGLLEVAALPGGFLSVARNVFERLRDAHPERAYVHHGEALHAFFHCPYGGGEDGAFCADWCKAGGAIWLDPELTLTHVDGGRSFTGSIGDWLRAG
jgi:hypothetical protein